jgi:hypothetical protein
VRRRLAGVEAGDEACVKIELKMSSRIDERVRMMSKIAVRCPSSWPG